MNNINNVNNINIPESCTNIKIDIGLSYCGPLAIQFKLNFTIFENNKIKYLIG